MRKFLFGSRKRKVFAALGAFALTTGTAIAAFIVFTGASGSGSGTFESQQTNLAVTITQDANGNHGPTVIGPGAVNQYDDILLTSNDPSAAHTVTSITSNGFTSNPPQCASHLSFGGMEAPSYFIPAGGSMKADVFISADASLPASCASGTWSVALVGNTTP